MHVLIAHPVSAGFALCWLLTILLVGMPKPNGNSSVAYRWVYGSLSFATGCLVGILHARFPAVPLPSAIDTANPSQGRVLQMPPPALQQPKQTA